jgi:hypothetical protein
MVLLFFFRNSFQTKYIQRISQHAEKFVKIATYPWKNNWNNFVFCKSICLFVALCEYPHNNQRRLELKIVLPIENDKEPKTKMYLSMGLRK